MRGRVLPLPPKWTGARRDQIPHAEGMAGDLQHVLRFARAAPERRSVAGVRGGDGTEGASRQGRGEDAAEEDHDGMRFEARFAESGQGRGDREGSGVFLGECRWRGRCAARVSNGGCRCVCRAGSYGVGSAGQRSDEVVVDDLPGLGGSTFPIHGVALST